VRDLRRAVTADPHADHVDADGRPAIVLSSQPEPRQPTQPAHLVAGDSLRHPAEPIRRAGLDFDEHHGASGDVGGDHIQLAESAPPIPFQHNKTTLAEIVGGQLLTQCAEFGAGQRCHGARLLAGTDNHRQNDGARGGYPQVTPCSTAPANPTAIAIGGDVTKP